MGEATFYLKARFRSKNEAELAVKIARHVLDDLAEFHKDWQRIRFETETPVKGRDMELRKNTPSLQSENENGNSRRHQKGSRQDQQRSPRARGLG